MCLAPTPGQNQSISLNLSSFAHPLYRDRGLIYSVFAQENVPGEILMLTAHRSFVSSAPILNLCFGFCGEAFLENITQTISFHILIFNILNYL